MEINSRQAVSHALKETATTTHLLVKLMKEELKVVPVKRITDPTPSELKASSLSSVRWSNKKLYSATVLAVGVSNFSPQLWMRILHVHAIRFFLLGDKNKE